MTYLSKITDVAAGRTRNEPEPVQFAGGAARETRHYVRRCSGGNSDCGRVLNESSAEAVCRVAEVTHYSANTTPSDVERVDDSLDQITQWPSSVKAVRHGKGIKDTDVSEVERGGPIVKIDMGASFRNTRHPSHGGWGHASIPRMQAQRACDAVNSNEHEGAVSFCPICSDERSFHKPNISVEGVRRSCTCVQVRSCAENRKEIRLTDKAFKVENQRGFVPGIGVDTLDRPWEKEV